MNVQLLGHLSLIFQAVLLLTIAVAFFKKYVISFTEKADGDGSFLTFGCLFLFAAVLFYLYMEHTLLPKVNANVVNALNCYQAAIAIVTILAIIKTLFVVCATKRKSSEHDKGEKI